MKLSETPFAQKLAKAPKASIAARVAAAEQLLADRRPEFLAKILALVEDTNRIAASRMTGSEARLIANASEIAGAAGLLGQPEIACIASWLAQLGDDMCEGGWNWEAVDVFCRALTLAAKSPDGIEPLQMNTLLAQLDAVRAAMKDRMERRASRDQMPSSAKGQSR